MVSAKSILAATVAASLVAANVAASKVASLSIGAFDVIVPAGFVGIAVAFLCTDLLSEVYGKDEARSAVNGAIAALAVSWGIIYAAVFMPSAPFYKLGGEFAAIMGQSALIVVASIVTLLVSQNLDVSIFHAIERRIPYKFARNVGSTAMSQAVDTALFISLGFVILPSVSGGSPMPLAAAWSLVVGQYVVKLGLVAFDTPLFYLLSSDRLL